MAEVEGEKERERRGYDYPRQMKEYLMRHIEETTRIKSVHERYFALRNMITFSLSHIKDVTRRAELLSTLSSIKFDADQNLLESYGSNLRQYPRELVMDQIYLTLLPQVEELWIGCQDELVKQKDIIMEILGPGDLLRQRVLERWMAEVKERGLVLQVPEGVDERESGG